MLKVLINVSEYDLVKFDITYGQGQRRTVADGDESHGRLSLAVELKRRETERDIDRTVEEVTK